MFALIVVIILIPSATNREEQGLPRFKASSEVWGTIYQGTDYSSGVAVLMSFVSSLNESRLRRWLTDLAVDWCDLDNVW